MKRSQKNPKGAYDIGPPVILPEGHKGDVRDLVGKSAAVSGKTVDMFNYIEAKTPKLADALCEGSYDECGNKITIGAVYKDLIPPLADHEKAGLEEDIKHYGCYCPIITWNGYIIDGHHRYEICTWYKLSFRVEEREFEDEISVKRWIIEHQFSRRNLPIEDRLRLAFEDIDLEALQEEAKKRKANNNRYMQVAEKEPINERSPVTSPDDASGKTIEKIAKKAGCSYGTAFQYKKVKDAGQLDCLKKGESIKKVAGDVRREERHSKHFSLKTNAKRS